MTPQPIRGRECFERRHIPRTRHHDVGLGALIVARKVPDTYARLTMTNGFFDREPLRRRLLAGHDHVDVVPRAETMIGDRKQRIRIGWKIDTNDLRLLVHDVIDKPRVLMAESVMILAPDV